VNVFNRVVVVLLLLVFISCTLLTILAAMVAHVQAATALADFSRNWLAQLFQNLTDATFEERLVFFLFGAFLAFIAFILLVLELLPGRPVGVKLAGVGGEAVLTVEAITQRLKFELENITGIREARPRVRPRGRQVDVDIDLRLDASVDVGPKTQEAVDVARRVLTDRLGVAPRQIRAFVRSVERPRPGAAAPPPAQAPTPPPAPPPDNPP
jgi:hypothetical protein